MCQCGFLRSRCQTRLEVQEIYWWKCRGRKRCRRSQGSLWTLNSASSLENKVWGQIIQPFSTLIYTYMINSVPQLDFAALFKLSHNVFPIEVVLNNRGKLKHSIQVSLKYKWNFFGTFIHVCACVCVCVKGSEQARACVHVCACVCVCVCVKGSEQAEFKST